MKQMQDNGECALTTCRFVIAEIIVGSAVGFKSLDLILNTTFHALGSKCTLRMFRK